jgi:Na+-driven multidrug efflux pump
MAIKMSNPNHAIQRNIQDDQALVPDITPATYKKVFKELFGGAAAQCVVGLSIGAIDYSMGPIFKQQGPIIEGSLSLDITALWIIVPFANFGQGCAIIAAEKCGEIAHLIEEHGVIDIRHKSNYELIQAVHTLKKESETRRPEVQITQPEIYAISTLHDQVVARCEDIGTNFRHTTYVLIAALAPMAPLLLFSEQIFRGLNLAPDYVPYAGTFCRVYTAALVFYYINQVPLQLNIGLRNYRALILPTLVNTILSIGLGQVLTNGALYKNVVNLPFSGFGVLGCAIGLSIGTAANLVISYAYCLKSKVMEPFKLFTLQGDKWIRADALKQTVLAAGPTVFYLIAEIGSWVALTYYLSSRPDGAIKAAAKNCPESIVFAGLMFFNPLGEALANYISGKVAQEDFQSARKAIYLASGFSIGIGGIGTGLFIFRPTAAFLASAYIPIHSTLPFDVAVREMAISTFQYLSFTVPMEFLRIVLVRGLNGYKDGFIGSVLSLVSQIAIGLGAAIGFSERYPDSGLTPLCIARTIALGLPLLVIIPRLFWRMDKEEKVDSALTRAGWFDSLMNALTFGRPQETATAPVTEATSLLGAENRAHEDLEAIIVPRQPAADVPAREPQGGGSRLWGRGDASNHQNAANASEASTSRCVIC